MRNYILVLLLLASNQLFAQFELGTFTTSGQKMTENAIKGSAVIVKQSFQVKNKKTGKVYGRSGRKEFGHSYFIGVKTEAGLVLTDESLKPWQNDEAFKKVEQEYEPLISMTELRDADSDNQTKYQQTPLHIGRPQPEGAWVASASDIHINSMELDLESGQKDGWLIWYFAKKDFDKNDTASIIIESINKKIDICEGSEIGLESPLNKNKIIGGIYVCPTYLGGGHVTYKLVGIAVRDDDKWKLLTPFVGFSYDKPSVSEVEQPKEDANSEKTSEEAVQEDQQDIELTPIDEGKKKKGKKSKK